MSSNYQQYEDAANKNSHIYDHKHATHGIGAVEGEVLPPHQSNFNPPPEEGHWTKGEHQPKGKFNDVIFGILFYIHLVIMFVVTGIYAPQVVDLVGDINNMNDRYLYEDSDIDEVNSTKSIGIKIANFVAKTTNHLLFRTNNDIQYDNERELEENDDISGTNDIGDMLLLLGISAIIALVISTAALSVMISHAEKLIKFALIFNIVATAVFAIGSLFLSPFAAIIGIFLLLLTVYYAYVVWGRIPFAACNLVSATTAVRSNLGLTIFAYNSLFIMIGWSCLWLVSFGSTVYITSGCNAQGECASEPNNILVFAMLLSYYWCAQVIKNVVHVTVAGTVGTWWFTPMEARSFCSHGVRDSFVRSVTTSFGSICLGSLLVAIVEAAKNMVRNLRNSEDGGGVLLCLAECLLSCLQDIMEYFNQWAFVFVGLYGYTFIDSGRNVINLFKTRGWTTIITDNLANQVLGMMSVAVGLITGLISLAIAHGQGMVFGDEVGASAASFFIGFILGVVLTSTLMTLVSSAVNTVIVCYAEAPQEFETNHPKLSGEMRAAWKQAWPRDFTY